MCNNIFQFCRDILWKPIPHVMAGLLKYWILIHYFTFQVEMEPCNPSTDTSTGTKQITTVSENPWICLFFMKFLHIYYSWMMPPLKVGLYMVYRQHICQREQYILSELLSFCLCIFYSQNAIMDWLWAVLEIRLASQGRRLCSTWAPWSQGQSKKRCAFFIFISCLAWN